MCQMKLWLRTDHCTRVLRSLARRRQRGRDSKQYCLATGLLPNSYPRAALPRRSISGRTRCGTNPSTSKVLKTEHFDIHYYDEEAGPATEVGRMAERWYTRLSKVLNHELSSRQPIILYADHPDFRATSVIPGHIGETTRGRAPNAVNAPIPQTARLSLGSSMAGRHPA